MVRKKIFIFFVLLSFVAAIGKMWHVAKGGFSIARIRPFYLSEQRNEPPSEEVKKILDQSFTYLGRGRQSYAFESRDGKYVLKFPRFDHFRLPFWRLATQLGKEALFIDKQKRYHFILGSFQICNEALREETGLLYLHLGESDFLHQRVEIVDRIGRSFLLDLDRSAFALQEKHPLFMPLLIDCLKRGEKEKAKEMIDSFLVVIAARAKKGIFNKDPTFLKNFGYDGKRAIQIDIGSFYRSNEGAEASFQQTMEQFSAWLEQIDPEKGC